MLPLIIHKRREVCCNLGCALSIYVQKVNARTPEISFNASFHFRTQPRTCWCVCVNERCSTKGTIKVPRPLTITSGKPCARDAHILQRTRRTTPKTSGELEQPLKVKQTKPTKKWCESAKWNIWWKNTQKGNKTHNGMWLDQRQAHTCCHHLHVTMIPFYVTLCIAYLTYTYVCVSVHSCAIAASWLFTLTVINSTR